ncbi:hypothetical protein CCACVL1_08888 [Corchorus capsularis]|uniref:Uncharacterized protein n=1 Tax=Corchorus capsularis TaxID=210143 RepID=A0A1R3IYH6_COCAP|nr:hypothetical protein CCACVL1_08888 [Corchorus capsularis]
MELRRATHFHFFQCIKGGIVVKCMNVDTRGRPELKFKEVKEIYDSGGAIDHNQAPRIHLRDDLESSPTKSNVFKVESPNSPLGSGIKVKSEPEAYDFDCSKSGGEGNDDLDDLSFGNMTLKQIKKRCKAKKRKRLNPVALNEETVETCSSIKHEFPDFQQKGDEYDLEEPLISWKSKLSKNRKSQRKCLRKSVSGSSPNALPIIKPEPVNSDEELLQPNGEWPAPIDIKDEVPEPGYSGCQTIFSNTSASDCSCSEQADSFVTDEGPDTTNVHILETNSPHPTKAPQCCSLNEVSYEYMENDTTNVHILESELPHPTKEPHCSLNEVSYEYMENSEPKFDEEASCWEIVKVDSPEIISYDYSDLSEFKKEDYIISPLHYDVSSEPLSPTQDNSCQSNSLNHEMPGQSNCYSLIPVPEATMACGVETGASFYPIEEPLCSDSNGVSYEYMEDVGPEFGSRFSGWEIVKVNSPEAISYQCSELEEIGEGSTLYLLPYDVSTESMSSSKDHSPDLNGSCRGNSSEHKMAWQTSDYSQIEVPEMDSDDKLQCLESINGGNAFSFESRVHDWPSNVRNIANSPTDNSLYWSPSCLNPEKHSVPVSGDSPSAGKHSLSPASRATTSFGAFNEPKMSPGHQDYLPMKQQCRPERLLSSRKAISPTSQERLCRAMELTGLDDDNEHQQCRKKLFFGKQTNHRILKAQGLDQIRREETTINPNPKSIMRKTKHKKKGSPPKGILKVTHPSRSVPHVGTAPTILQRCSQSAIAFSQRQMRDIESLATKLTTELTSMKEIAKGRLHCEASAATKENADEVCYFYNLFGLSLIKDTEQLFSDFFLIEVP